jgi:hypothetical protein
VSADTASKWTPLKKLSASAIYGIPVFICYMCESRQTEATELHESSLLSLTDLTKLNRLPKSQTTKKVIGWRNVFVQITASYKHQFLVEIIEIMGSEPKKRLQITGEFSEPEILCEVIPPYNDNQKRLFNQRFNEFIEILRDLNYEVFQSAWKTSID